MTTRSMCSHCHALGEPGQHLCDACGHELGVPRVDCQCDQCAAQRHRAEQRAIAALQREPLYRAFYEDYGQILYSRRPAGNLIGELPLGTRPDHAGQNGTLDRTDGGDTFERAVFVTPSGRRIVVMRMEAELV